MCNHIVPAFACADCGADYGAPLECGPRPYALETHAEWLARHNMVEDDSLPPGAMISFADWEAPFERRAREAATYVDGVDQATPEDLSVDRTFENETRLH